MTTDDDPQRAPDHPRVPRPRPSRLLRAYVGLGLVTTAGFAGAGMTGLGIDDATERAEIPPSVRASPGGYRSFHFWHSGYSGGK